MPRSSKRPRLTEAGRDARRQADRERVEQAARALLTSDGWRRWIKVRASNGLARYSLRNQLLIAIDCHHGGITPTYVAGFRAFLALNRCVRKGEKAIHILAPVTVKQRDDHGKPTDEKKVFFRAVPVFDVSMTDPLPRQQPVPLAPPSEPITGDSHQHLIAPLTVHAATLGYRVEIRELPEHGPGGWCDPTHKKITVAAGPANRQVRILVHELAHAHGLGYQQYGRERCEVLVDCVTYCVLGSLGLDIASESIPYIAGWGKTAPSTPSATTPRPSTPSPTGSNPHSNPRPTRTPRQSTPKPWRRSRSGLHARMIGRTGRPTEPRTRPRACCGRPAHPGRAHAAPDRPHNARPTRHRG